MWHETFIPFPPEHVQESLIKLYEADWWRYFDGFNGKKKCDWAHISIPGSSEGAFYVNVYRDSKEYKESNTLRLPTADQTYIIEGQRYIPQDVAAICSFMSESQLNTILNEMRNLYSRATENKWFFLKSGDRTESSKTVRVIREAYELEFPIVSGGGTMANGLETILGEYLSIISRDGTKRFYDYLLGIQGELRGNLGKAPPLSEWARAEKGRAAEELVNLFFNR
ncbi:hypothetical protein HY212_04405 [Candidatus Pacearchaeota archaeon]|nr:hypothetical protein [Candidatus Pacearchaeota archaeon]